MAMFFSSTANVSIHLICSCVTLRVVIFEGNKAVN
jgi:hypothetical protein